MITQVTGHLLLALERLLEQYKGKPKLEAVISSYIAEIQALENAASTMPDAMYLPDAEGAQLDVIGRLVGEPREGRADDLFKLWIAARILINASTGTRNEIIRCLRAVTDSEFTITEFSPPHIHIQFTEALPDLAVAYAEIANEARGAGIGLSAQWPTVEPGLGFTFKNIGDLDDPALGFQTIAFP